MDTITKKSSQLCTGDVVVTHGMRCLIDGEMRVTEYGDPVHYYEALVLNRDDVPDARVPLSWTARRGRHAGEHRWQIQGNDLATWQVEVSPKPGARVRIVVPGSRLDGREATVVREVDANVLLYGTEPMLRVQPDEEGGPEAECYVTAKQIEVL